MKAIHLVAERQYLMDRLIPDSWLTLAFPTRSTAVDYAFSQALDIQDGDPTATISVLSRGTAYTPKEERDVALGTDLDGVLHTLHLRILNFVGGFAVSVESTRYHLEVWACEPLDPPEVLDAYWETLRAYSPYMEEALHTHQQ